MAMTLHEFMSHLWNCAEILRGSAVDRTNWKAYNLSLLFFKRICDVWDEDIPPLAEAVAAFMTILAGARAAEDRLREVLVSGGWMR